MYKNTNSSWDHFNYGNLSRNIFSSKQRATMFRISLLYSHHNLLRTAGEAVLGTSFSIPEVCQLLLGLQSGCRRAATCEGCISWILENWLQRMQYPLHQTIAHPPFHAESFPANWGQRFLMHTRFIGQISSWKACFYIVHYTPRTVSHETIFYETLLPKPLWKRAFTPMRLENTEWCI